MDLKKAQKKVDDWINLHGVRYFNELTNMAILSEEVGEVAKIIARKYGEQSSKKDDNTENLADELSVSRQTVNSIENGKFDPSLTLAIKLTKYFKVPLEEIFIYED